MAGIEKKKDNLTVEFLVPDTILECWSCVRLVRDDIMGIVVKNRDSLYSNDKRREKTEVRPAAVRS